MRLENDDPTLLGLLDLGVAAAIGFLILSEVFKMFQIYHSEGISTRNKAVRVVISPFQLIPILVHHFERKLELKMHALCAISEPTGDDNASLTNTRDGLAYILRLKGEQRATENVLEHFVQFLLSIAILHLHLCTSKVLLFQAWLSFNNNKS